MRTSFTLIAAVVFLAACSNDAEFTAPLSPTSASASAAESNPLAYPPGPSSPLAYPPGPSAPLAYPPGPSAPVKCLAGIWGGSGSEIWGGAGSELKNCLAYPPGPSVAATKKP